MKQKKKGFAGDISTKSKSKLDHGPFQLERSPSELKIINTLIKLKSNGLDESSMKASLIRSCIWLDMPRRPCILGISKSCCYNARPQKGWEAEQD